MKDLSGLCIACGELRDLSVTRYGCVCHAYTKPKKQRSKKQRSKKRREQASRDGRPSWQGNYKPAEIEIIPTKKKVKKVIWYEAKCI